MQPASAMNWALTTLPELEQHELEGWLLLLEERTGISFDKHRKILQTGLTQRMREIGCQNYGEYYNQVRFAKGGASEWAALLKTLTVKETRFWRDPDAMGFLRAYLIKLLSSGAHHGPLEVWSVASSTGEEPYSLAMLCSDSIESLGAHKLFGITATDICLSSLAIARKGIYPKRRLDTLASALQERFFNKLDENTFEVKKTLKDRVCFAHANLINLDELPIKDMDVIYCQNVLIYFKKARQQQVLDELVERLKPKGLLIVGMGEAQGWQNNKVTRIKNNSVQAYVKNA